MGEVREFGAFNPYDPRPALPPEIGPGTMAALYDDRCVRLTDWKPLPEGLTPHWTVESGWRPRLVVLWDGGERWSSMPLSGPGGEPVEALMVLGDTLHVVLPYWLSGWGAPEVSRG